MTVWTDSIGFFRARFAETYEDACTIARTTDRGTYNPATNRHETPSGSTLYTGACLIRPAGLSADVRDRGDADVSVGRYEVRIPYDEDGIAPDDLLTITASTYDSDLVGEEMVIIDVMLDTYNTHRLLNVELNLGRGQP